MTKREKQTNTRTRKTIVLHIGPHKTGSTAIQRQIKENADLLTENNWSSPNLDADYYGAQHLLASTILKGDLEKAEELVGSFINSPHDILLSSEIFSTFADKDVKFLASAFSSCNVVVVFYLRSPIESLYSRWQELIKHGYSRSFPEFFARRCVQPFNDEFLNPAVCLRPWDIIQKGWRLAVELFDRHEEVTDDFFSEYLGIKCKRNEGSPVFINKSMGPHRTEAYRRLCGHQIFINGDDEMRTQIRVLTTKIEEAEMLSSFNLHFGNAIFSTIERNFITEFGEAIKQPFNRKDIFLKRDAKLSYIDQNIWFVVPEIDAFARDVIKASKYRNGEPKLDSKLRHY